MRSHPSHEPADRRVHVRAVATALFVTLLWSSSWILIRVGLDDHDLAPLTFAGLRYSVAAIVLLAWVGSSPRLRNESRTIIRTRWRPLVVLGVVYFAITQGAQFVAIDAQPAATSSLMLAPTALLVALMSSRSLAEQPRRLQFVGAALIIVGAVLYFSGDLGATVIGMTASIIGLCANAAGSLLGRSINRDGSLAPVLVTASSMSVGAALLLLAGLVVEGWPHLTVRLVLIIGWLAVVNTALAFTLWNRSLRDLAAVESSAINNTMLIQIAALAWVFLGESPGPIGVVGILVVSTGAFLTTYRSSR
ncbi:DMT family transporter [Ilumatobacter nonamiensis]|uniref:DMT family transporter n=1 Tax=Ilumatobacter nonamiensis TaxID=467093 RepID=UPI00034D5240|nr:DMT family transporter [Ilumatobacter nonamiensis]